MTIARRLGRTIITLPLALMLANGVAPAKAADGVLQCVPYARAVSGIAIRGDAWTWWDQARGRYARGYDPRPGAVMAMANSGAMPLGHVAVVSRIIDERHILLRHANWSGPGLIETDVLAVDTSPDNDWSQVRIWWGQSQQMGARDNPVNGFIYPEVVRADAVMDDAMPRDEDDGFAAPVRVADAPRLIVDATMFRRNADSNVTYGRAAPVHALALAMNMREGR